MIHCLLTPQNSEFFFLSHLWLSLKDKAKTEVYLSLALFG